MNDAENRLVFLVSQVEKVLVEARTNQELLKSLILKLDRVSPSDPPLTETEVDEYCMNLKLLGETTTKAETNRDLKEFLPDFEAPGPDDRLN